MNILIVGGRNTSEFILKSLISKKHKVAIINTDYEYCKKLSRKYDALVICGDGTKPYMLEEANIYTVDIVIALTQKDSDNLAICQLAKNVYRIKKVFATVTNPKNVEVFKSLGIDAAISSTYIVADMIEQMATVDEIHRFIPIEDGKVSIMEIVIKENYNVCGKLIKDIGFSKEAIIGCIIRGSNSIIPKGNTKIFLDDKLIVLSSPNAQKNIISDVIGGVGKQ
ncbi:potassium channel family protein [[Clostridium] dakarense]|uniref:potassium channel family protein n=1 Tax=Faecalimicrobium dakarense TaxID=1301100 RepID=UPI0004AD039B|nr:NAD-binding protein [[Clostridium] dakarense]